MDPKMIDRLIDLGYVQQTLAELVSIPSVNPPQGRGEEEAARHLALRMEELGADVSVDQVTPGRANAVGILGWPRTHPGLERPSRRCSRG